MKEIYNGETVALGGPNLVTKELVVDDATGEKAKFTYDKTTGSVTVLDEVDPDSINPVTSRAVATAVAGGSAEITVDQSYNAFSENPQSGTAVAQAIGEVNAVPPSGLDDAGKFLIVGAKGSPKWASPGGDVFTLAGSETADTIMELIGKGKIVQYFSTDANPATGSYVYNRYTLAQYIPAEHTVYLCGIYKSSGIGDFCLGTWTISGSTWTKTQQTFSFQ